jgi:hypothetical protein
MTPKVKATDRVLGVLKRPAIAIDSRLDCHMISLKIVLKI